jgi:hypothetical protein
MDIGFCALNALVKLASVCAFVSAAVRKALRKLASVFAYVSAVTKCDGTGKSTLMNISFSKDLAS